MHQINLDDQLHQYAQRRAAESGCADAQAYVTLMLQMEQQEGENFDHLFTPERLAEIDRAAAQVEAGEGITLDEFDLRLAEFKDQWQRQQK